MNHVVFLSGGLGSWATLRRVIEAEGVEKTFTVFTDTLIEDKSLYLFLIESLEVEYGVEAAELRAAAERIPETTHDTQEARKKYLTELGEKAESVFPNLYWRNDGRDVWDIFFEDEMLGNSRLAKCSHVIKQDLSKRIIESNFNSRNTILYLGIDWTEDHRTKAPKKNWKPYEVRFPMCEAPLLTNIDHIKELEKLGISIPKLYLKGFSHNNCGGFCVRAGQGHFINLLKELPGLYQYHEEMEQKWQRVTGKEYTILRKQRNGVRERYSLKELREDYESERKREEIDLGDIGGCGCFVDDE